MVDVPSLPQQRLILAELSGVARRYGQEVRRIAASRSRWLCCQPNELQRRQANPIPKLNVRGCDDPCRESDVIWDHMVQGARVSFMPSQGDAPATVDNIDAHVYLVDGTHRYATFMTTVAIDRVLQKWAKTGETGGGWYFWCSDLVIVPRPGVEAMVAAVGEMIRSGDIDVILGKVEDGSI
ncbi:hypothetical protein [Salinispora fenicalii]|uniref:hypothetical protein n=1 Tax=Salinispora fenicalii TaxID=1137263 RepID=UPI0004B3C45D|nr:hypothetical protein [Salinispora fenicalii]